MKRRNKWINLIAFAVFVLFVGVSGYALSASGYVDNPFDQISFLSRWAGGGEGRFERRLRPETTTNLSSPDSNTSDSPVNVTDRPEGSGQFQLPPPNQLNRSGSDAPIRFRGEGDGPGDQNGIQWSNIGDVLYNLWFICAATAVFIVVQYLFKLSVRRVKSYLPARAK